ncbi:hypothetical protein KY334_07670 [Candidatus Woesearchaeota archaeon]|nr:hypothetical protein [Candidatus Woesearchaeota archaeon]
MPIIDTIVEKFSQTVNPWVEMGKTFLEPLGYLPLVALILVFFIIRHFLKQIKWLIIYGVLALIIYLWYLYLVAV